MSWRSETMEERQHGRDEEERRGKKRPRTYNRTEECRSGYSYSALLELSHLPPTKLTEELCREMKKFVHTLNDKHTTEFFNCMLDVIYKVITEIQQPESDASREKAKRIIAEVFSERGASFRNDLATHIKSSQHIATIQHVCHNIFVPLAAIFPHYAHSLPISELKKAAISCSDKRLCDEVQKLENLNMRRSGESSDDYCRMPVVPTWSEMRVNQRPMNLEANIIEGPYDDWSHYFNVHFRLLREDFLAPLRRGISSYRQGKRGKELSSDVTVYTSVQITGLKFLLSGLCYDVKFDCSRFRKSGWEHSKRLLPGSLLCLSPDPSNFEDFVLLATVAERRCESLQRGYVTIRFENNDNIQSICNNMKKKFIMLEPKTFFEASRHVMSSLQQAEIETLPFTEYIIKAECISVKPPLYLNNATCFYDMSCVYCNKSVPTQKAVMPEPEFGFHSYVNSNEACSTLEDRGCSMSEDGACSTSEDGACSTSEDGACTTSEDGACTTSEDGACTTSEDGACSTSEDEACITSKGHLEPCTISGGNQEVHSIFVDSACNTKYSSASCGKMAQSTFNILDPLQWPKEDISEMDQSQLEALKLALTKEVALIQGPPGTGKTFVGLKIVEVLLNNKQQWDQDNLSPILVVCFTNHALDQFLEGILDIKLKRKDHSKPKIARIGGRCKSEKVNAFNIDKLCFDPEMKDFKSSVKGTQKKLQGETNCFQRYLDWQTSRKLLTLSQLNYIANPDHVYQLSLISKNRAERDHELEIWLQLRDEKSHLGRNEEMEVEISSSKGNKDAVIVEERHLGNSNLLEMPIENRRQLYDSWVFKYYQSEIKHKQEELREYSVRCVSLEERKNESYCCILEERDVIGMTTTGAAKYQKMLCQIKPKIVIIEEAAEVLEAHIVSTLTSGTQHLILIGDHKQLRPKLNEYELVKMYNFDVSLFERLVNNKLPHATLNTQHRMRPEIAGLVHPYVYPTLYNHPSVLHYESIMGVEKNMFFITHQCSEEKSQDASYMNCHEAKFMASLCQYLLQQGYAPGQITILTPYSGQLLKLHQSMPKDIFSGVCVTTVDNFQGEENDIVLLSLVRSNADGNPGFLREMNRACVALSRAKKGFYCIGNFTMLRKSVQLFDKIMSGVEIKGYVGESISLYCQTHMDKRFVAKLPEDFSTNAPDGGCLYDCSYILPCGHSCTRKCHVVDKEHLKYICKKPCQSECPNHHPCQKLCFEDCSRCEVIMEKQMSLCHHTKELPCHVDTSSVPCEAPCLRPCRLNHPCQLPCYKPCRCDVDVEIIMPGCGHVQDIPCHLSSSVHECKAYVTKVIPKCQHEQRMLCSSDPNTFPCEERCAMLMPCGHKCPLMCKEPCSIVCHQIVDEIQLECNHLYQRECHEKNNSKIQCLQQCTRILSCGHPCALKCYVTCESAGCLVPVSKRLPCGHTVEAECYKFHAPNGYQCDEECTKKLICDHQCPGKCGEACNPAQCQQMCSKVLLCGHRCFGICGECYERRMHLECSFDVKMTPFCGHTVYTACRGFEYWCQKEGTYSCPHRKQKIKWPFQLPRCTEPCVWQCPHHKCTKLCFESCDRGPCGMRCPRSLKCGHPCASLCGEPCLKACPLCKGPAFTRYLRHTDGKNGKLVPNQLYIQLQACSHIFPVGELDHYVKQKRCVCPIQCPHPKCGTNICCGFRYGNAAKSALIDCARVSNRVMEVNEQFSKYKKSVISRLQSFRGNHSRIVPEVEIVHMELERYREACIDMTMDECYFIHLLLVSHVLITHLARTEPEFASQFSEVCSNFILLCKDTRTGRILLSEQLVKDFTSEMFRIYLTSLLHEAQRSGSSSSDLRSSRQTEDYLKTLEKDHFQRISLPEFKKHSQRIIRRACVVDVSEVPNHEEILKTRCQWVKCQHHGYFTSFPMIPTPTCPKCNVTDNMEI